MTRPAVLLVSFKHFLADERERGRAQKRGGGRVVFPLDTAAIEAGLESALATAPPSEAFSDRAWAIATVNLALSQLEAEFVAGDRHRLFQTLKPFLEGDGETPGYAEVARQLGTTNATIAVTVSRMRQRYRELLRASVAQTVATPVEVEEELRHLLAALIGR